MVFLKSVIVKELMQEVLRTVLVILSKRFV